MDNPRKYACDFLKLIHPVIEKSGVSMTSLMPYNFSPSSAIGAVLRFSVYMTLAHQGMIVLA